jgi:hypothetical protein
MRQTFFAFRFIVVLVSDALPQIQFEYQSA